MQSTFFMVVYVWPLKCDVMLPDLFRKEQFRHLLFLQLSLTRVVAVFVSSVIFGSLALARMSRNCFGLRYPTLRGFSCGKHIVLKCPNKSQVDSTCVLRPLKDAL